MATAFSLIHSGAAPATGRSDRSSPSPPSSSTLVAAIRMRLLSTQEPICSTGGMPTASQTSRRLSPAFASAASGVSKSGLAQAMAEQPVCKHQNVALDQFLGQLHMRAVGLDLWIGAADNAYRHRECGHR